VEIFLDLVCCCLSHRKRAVAPSFPRYTPTAGALLLWSVGQVEIFLDLVCCCLSHRKRAVAPSFPRYTPTAGALLLWSVGQVEVCVQLSDDISAWEYRHGERAAKNDDLMNAADSAAKRYIVSPVNAAQFILAKMRGTAEPRPELGGVYMLGSCARTFADEPVKRRHFILGDFMVVDSSPVRFDTKMTLKEDYDFSCAHIRAHGSVMRCQRMTLNVKHYSNAGGAVAVRDQSGKQEKANLDILFAKWPRAFSLNPMRKNEVRLRWPADDDAEGLNHPTVGSKLKQHGGKAKISPKSSPKPVMKKLVKKQEVPPGLPPLSAVLERASSTPKNPAIALRCKRVAGQTVARVLEGFNFKDKGANVKYRLCDLTYDLRRGHLVAKRSRATAKLGG